MTQNSLRIGFYTSHFHWRGTCVALFDYADYCEKILGHQSFVISRNYPQNNNLHDPLAFRRFHTRFPTFCFQTIEQLELYCRNQQLDAIYVIKYGRPSDDSILNDLSIPLLIHCVFDMSIPHGLVFAGVSKTLANRFGYQNEYVSHMVTLKPKPCLGNLRHKLGIPPTDFVIGRHGGIDTFNIEWAMEALSETLRTNPNVWVVLCGAPKWDQHPRLIFLDPIYNRDDIAKYIDTCNVMIVPERLGHTFGLAIAEFSVHNKPIWCYNGKDLWNRAHIEILGEKGIYFQTKSELLQLSTKNELNPNSNLNAYTEYTPEIIIQQFNQVFLYPLQQYLQTKSDLLM